MGSRRSARSVRFDMAIVIVHRILADSRDSCTASTLTCLFGNLISGMRFSSQGICRPEFPRKTVNAAIWIPVIGGPSIPCLSPEMVFGRFLDIIGAPGIGCLQDKSQGLSHRIRSKSESVEWSEMNFYEKGFPYDFERSLFHPGILSERSTNCAS